MTLAAIPCPTKQLCDVNGDGSVTKPELKEALWSLGQHPSEEEMDLIFREYDAGQTGTLDFNEFKLLMMARLTYKVILSVHLLILGSKQGATASAHTFPAFTTKFLDIQHAACTQYMSQLVVYPWRRTKYASFRR